MTRSLILGLGDCMQDPWARRNVEKEVRIYNALGATLNGIIHTEGASNAVVAQSCGAFLARGFAGLRVDNGDTDAQITQRVAMYMQALQESIWRNVRMLRQRGHGSSAPSKAARFSLPMTSPTPGACWTCARNS